MLALRTTLNREQMRISDYDKRMEQVRRSDRDGAWERREIDRLTTMKNAVVERMGRQIEALRAA